jgi:hypothetical protein
MPSALVVYESMFGDTEVVAHAIAEGLATSVPVDVVPVSEAPRSLGAEVGLLVVGAPTHAFGMSMRGTRESAVERGAHPAGGTDRGVREWIAGLRPEDAAAATATFDTRFRKRWIPGSAARRMRGALRRAGLALVADPQSFYVADTAGPLLDGERDRARAWGTELAASMTTPEEHRSDT